MKEPTCLVSDSELLFLFRQRPDGSLFIFEEIYVTSEDEELIGCDQGDELEVWSGKSCLCVSWYIVVKQAFIQTQSS